MNAKRIQNKKMNIASRINTMAAKGQSTTYYAVVVQDGIDRELLLDMINDGDLVMSHTNRSLEIKKKNEDPTYDMDLLWVADS